MARTVKINARYRPQMGGFTTSGTPRQGKEMVWGLIDITSYTTNGETIAPTDLGLTTIDHVSFTVKSVAGADVAATAEASAVYRPVADLLLVFASAATQVTSTNAAEVTFFACGDSAAFVETLP